MVRIRQYHGSKLSDTYFGFVPEKMTDEEYLDLKASSHEQKGWTVVRDGIRLTAKKTRWKNVSCRRVFEIV